MLDELGVLKTRQPLLGCVGPQLFEIGNDESAREAPAFGDDDGGRNERAGLELVLDRLGGDELTARRLEQVLFAVGDLEIAVGVDFADVAGVQPTVDQGRCGRLGVLIVALHDVGPADQDLTVVGDLDLDVANDLTDGAEAGLSRLVDGDDGRGLGEAVGFVDSEARRRRRTRRGDERAGRPRR